MRTIALTQGQVALIDDEDFDRVSVFKWCAHWESGTNSYYAASNLSRKTILMHQVVLGFPLSYIDHKNGDTLDNRKSNLRLATQSQNMQNARLRRDNKSGLKGVSFDSARGRWHAQIQVVGRKRHLGRFNTAREAAQAYREAADRLFGEFARY